MLYSDYQVNVMGQVPYVGFVTRSRATAMTRFTFCIKKKNGSSHESNTQTRIVSTPNYTSSLDAFDLASHVLLGTRTLPEHPILFYFLKKERKKDRKKVF
jgi:hypothetical protein